MRWLKSAYASAARDIGRWPALRPSLDRAAVSPKDGLGFWAASLTAIHDIDRMVALDIPWWNVAATREVERLLAASSRPRVFEYGSGASTVWLARRAAELVSIEHEPDWADQVERRLHGHAHVSLRRRPLGDRYVHAIDECGGGFDLIVVDGRDRVACLKAALPRLAAGGYILFDDSGRRRYRAGIAACGLPERHFFGRSYCVPYPDHTSLIGPRPAR